MATFALQINCDNDVFGPHQVDCDFEIGRILHDVASRIESGRSYHQYQTIFDVNGNDVGRFVLVGYKEQP